MWCAVDNYNYNQLYRVSKKKTAVIMKGQIKDRHNALIYFKCIYAKGGSNSYKYNL